jgi:coenzyme F420-0:L-glutamate ligase/coenzyme F420-1:gamma-L-glutamate ligase
LLNSPIRLLGVTGLGEIGPGDDLGELIVERVAPLDCRIGAGDIFVVAQKVVSKAEGRIVRLDSVEPSAHARNWAETYQKDPRVIELILNESRRIVRMDRGVLIAETQHGFVCANAGVDSSNCPTGFVTLLPKNPDDSAERLRAQLEKALSVPLGVIISDSFGRPWREGQINCSLGVAGLAPLVDYRGERDAFGRVLQATVIAVADELSAAAELVMGKTRRVPVVVIQGYVGAGTCGSGRDLIRAPDTDLFR